MTAPEDFLMVTDHKDKGKLRELTNWFSIQKGVRQGRPVSLVSFNLYSEEVTKRSADELGWIGVNISRRRLNNLRFADDVVLTV